MRVALITAGVVGVLVAVIWPILPHIMCWLWELGRSCQ